MRKQIIAAFAAIFFVMPNLTLAKNTNHKIIPAISQIQVDNDNISSFFINEANKGHPINYSIGTSSFGKDTLQVASQYNGKTGRGNRQELKRLFNQGKIPKLDPAYTPWCAAFANSILESMGIEGTHSLLAKSFLHWHTGTSDPKHGDIVVLGRRHGGHVGFFDGFEYRGKTKYVKVYGGNTKHSVKQGYFPASRVSSYRSV
jgi:uncharacterized protein (TIGR02594 family)